jgi:hypothetical protein
MVEEEPQWAHMAQQAHLLILQFLVEQEDLHLAEAVVAEAYPHLHCADAIVHLGVMVVEDPHDHIFCGKAPVAPVCILVVLDPHLTYIISAWYLAAC